MLRVTHFELPADNPEKLVEFYQKVFGWTIQKWDGPMDYWLIVPSVDDYVAKIEGVGGSVVAPKMPVPGVGYLAYCKDPEGNVFCIMEEDGSVK
jgi:predicted enzyme related to lactoylglutathione lyase